LQAQLFAKAIQLHERGQLQLAKRALHYKQDKDDA
jgi:hypothetical protein